jgi:hypothetical protein
VAGGIWVRRTASRFSIVERLSVEVEMDAQGFRQAGDRREAGVVQCDIKAGTVILLSRVRLTPPSTNSRMREWP